MASGFFTQAMADIGGAMRSAQQYQAEDQAIQMNQQQIDMNKMSLMSQQRDEKAKADIGAFMTSKVASDRAAFDDPFQMAKLQREAAVIAGKDGSYKMMREMEEEVKQSYAEGKQALAAQAQEKQAKLEDLAKEAYTFTSDPTNPEAQKALVQKAIDAGVNPTTIPKPDEPVKMLAFAQQQKTAALSAKERAAFVEKVRTDEIAEANRREQLRLNDLKERELERNNAANREFKETKLEEIRESKAARKSAAYTTPKIKQFGDDRYQYDPEHKFSGKRQSDVPGSPGNEWAYVSHRNLGMREQGAIDRTIQSATEIVRGVNNLKGFGGTAMSPFSHLPGESLLGAFERLGTTSATPDLVAAYDSTATGLGNEYAGMLAAFGGQMMGAQAQKEFQRMIAREPGQSNLVSAYKLSNGLDIVRTYLQNVPFADENPKIQKILESFKGFKEPSYYLDKMQAADRKKTGKTEASKFKLEELNGKAVDAAKTPATAAPPSDFTIN